MSQEPTQTQPNPNGTGRPEISDDQYGIWLNDMRPFLRQGHSLNYSINKACLNNHRTALYEKSRLGDWFSDKITYFQATISELNNSAIFKVIENVHAKLVETDKYIPNSGEIQIMKLVTEKHRLCSSSKFSFY